MKHANLKKRNSKKRKQIIQLKLTQYLTKIIYLTSKCKVLFLILKKKILKYKANVV